MSIQKHHIWAYIWKIDNFMQLMLLVRSEGFIPNSHLGASLSIGVVFKYKLINCSSKHCHREGKQVMHYLARRGIVKARMGRTLPKADMEPLWVWPRFIF